MTQAPFVHIDAINRHFEVSKPWLSQIISRERRLWLKAVQDVTFDIARGETFALVGESGSGKTTVARMVVGLLTPTSGSVWNNTDKIVAT